MHLDMPRTVRAEPRRVAVTDLPTRYGRQPDHFPLEKYFFPLAMPSLPFDMPSLFVSGRSMCPIERAYSGIRG